MLSIDAAFQVRREIRNQLQAFSRRERHRDGCQTSLISLQLNVARCRRSESNGPLSRSLVPVPVALDCLVLCLFMSFSLAQPDYSAAGHIGSIQ
jgi:hypothetical protein